MREICEYKGRQTANNLIGQAIDNALNHSDTDYLNVIYDSDGNISSLSVDAAKVNSLENNLKNEINSVHLPVLLI
jgi:hypothetical protein